MYKLTQPSVVVGLDIMFKYGVVDIDMTGVADINMFGDASIIGVGVAVFNLFDCWVFNLSMFVFVFSTVITVVSGASCSFLKPLAVCIVSSFEHSVIISSIAIFTALVRVLIFSIVKVSSSGVGRVGGSG